MDEFESITPQRDGIGEVERFVIARRSGASLEGEGGDALRGGTSCLHV